MGFGVYLKTKIGERQRAGEMTEVYPNQRYNSHLVPEDGSLTCSTPGICECLPPSLEWGGGSPTSRRTPVSLTPTHPPLVSPPADVLRFDNTYSYLHAKKVSYSVEVLRPDAASAQQIQKLGDKLSEVALNHSP